MSCNLLDRDQTFFVTDYGPSGFLGTANIPLAHGLKNGGIISAVFTTDQDIAINVKDTSQNILIHVVFRVLKNDFGINSFLSGKWGTEEKVSNTIVHKGLRTATTLVYEEEGYRVFINGAQIAFYKHRSTNAPHLLEITTGQIFKIIYLTTKNIIP